MSMTTNDAAGRWVQRDGDTFYRIADFEGLTPFFLSVPSDTDLWMFITSGGGLTAGRVDASGSLFPYLTVDQLHDAHHHTGPVTLIRLEGEDGLAVIWEPFVADNSTNPAVNRNLYKNVTGNRIVFEEINRELGLAFSYQWSASSQFGWVRTARLENLGTEAQRVDLLDGLRNVLPHGAPLAVYQQASTLVDAYKRTDVDPDTGLGLFSLTAGITDRAEAREVLTANTVWCCGLDQPKTHLNLQAIQGFRAQRVLAEDRESLGGRGNYLVTSTVDLEPGQFSRWHLVADVGLDHLQIARLRQLLGSASDLAQTVEASLEHSQRQLERLIASADGQQYSARTSSSAHHFANVLYNCMRGGVFHDNDHVPVADFQDFLEVRNPQVARLFAPLLEGLPQTLTITQVRALAEKLDTPDAHRLCLEYLPLHFGRRHGDPSRPWNQFAIRVRDAQGQPALDYQGNWRDIFQNWEALATAFPEFLPHFTAKFLNASTIDGFNPYRISREGVDWESEEADDPWSNIGYWGDHQIIYLLKLLESWQAHDPGAMATMLDREVFSYAEVPYRLKSFPEILANPAETIVFDHQLDRLISGRVATQGSDGRLLRNADGHIRHANLLEKLLVPALSKLSNLVPGAGIWMNTQRPEWNDANNALAAGGVSVVTLCYLRRYLTFLVDLLDRLDDQPLSVAGEVVTWFEELDVLLERETPLLDQAEVSPKDRLRLMTALGTAFSRYREAVYHDGFSGHRKLSTQWVETFCRRALRFVDHSIEANRRHDSLFHTYNLLEVGTKAGGVTIKRLPVMLEGQVAALSSGLVDPDEALVLLEALYQSPLYTADRHSFLLYPTRQLPSFLDKNLVPAERAEAIPLLRSMLDRGQGDILAHDDLGACRFHPSLQNARDLEEVLDRLEESDPEVAADRSAVVALFTHVFRHDSYTGRSGYMYGYEGIGCIYWHMVAKLLLAVQEITQQALCTGAPESTREGLARMYLRIRSGLGYEKSASAYGAFPTDPYSHTPGDGGARQPGMTGQVKEEILTRRGELGLKVVDGSLGFAPYLLEKAEFSTEPGAFTCWDLWGKSHTFPVAEGMMAFTCCQVPILYRRTTGKGKIEVDLTSGTTRQITGLDLGPDLSRDLFCRRGTVAQIRVDVPENMLRSAWKSP